MKPLGDQWNDLAPKDRKALTLLAAFLAGMGLYLLGVAPLVQTLSDMSARRESLLTDRAAYREKAGLADSRVRKLEALRKDFQTLSSDVDVRDTEGLLLTMSINEVYQYARNMGLAVEALNPLAPATGRHAEELPMEMSFQGPYEPIVKFLYYLETSPSVLRISDFTLTRRPEGMAGRMRLSKFSFLPPEAKGAPKVQPTLRVMAYPWVGDAPFFIAREKGWLDQDGEHIRLVTPTLAGEQDISDKLLATGQLDAATGIMTRVSTYLIQGLPVRIVAPTSQVTHALSLLASRVSSIRSVADLRGRTVFLQTGGMGHYALYEALKPAGIRMDQIRVEQMAPRMVAQSLQAGLIDLGVTWSGYAKPLEESGVVHKISPAGDQWKELSTGYILATQHALTHRREPLRLLLDAYFRALEWWRANPEEGLILAAHSMGFPVERVRATLDFVTLYDRAQVLEQVCGKDGLADRNLAEGIRERQGFFKAVWGAEMDIPVAQVTDWGVLRQVLGCGAAEPAAAREGAQ